MTRSSQLFLARVRRAVTTRLMRGVFFLLRALRPIFRVPDARLVPRSLRRTVWVTRFSHVHQVLALDGAYSVRRFGSRMRETGPDFFLGHDAGPRREGEREAAVAALAAYPWDRVYPMARDLTLAILLPRIAAARRIQETTGDRPCELDVVADVGNVVPVRIAEAIFGLENPGEKRLLEWVQLTSWYIFHPAPSEADRDRAIRAGREMADHVDRLVQARRETWDPRDPGDSVLDRLLAAGLSDRVIVRNLSGLAAGTLGPPPRLFANAMDRLLGLSRGRLRRLRRAASEGRPRDVEAHVLEAGRLAPDPAFIHRTCRLSSTTLGGHPIETGAIVVCAVGSALRDSRSIRRPRRFRPGRPSEEQMLFGAGIHWCIGRDIGMAMLTGMALPLLALPGVRRAPGGTGHLAPGPWRTYPGQNYPAHLVVRYQVPPSDEGASPGADEGASPGADEGGDAAARA